jgi:hypothetical protein
MHAWAVLGSWQSIQAEGMNQEILHSCMQMQYSALRKFAWMRSAEHDGLADATVMADARHWVSRPFCSFSVAQRQSFADETTSAAKKKGGCVF